LGRTRCGLECNGMIEGKWRDERSTMREMKAVRLMIDEEGNSQRVVRLINAAIGTIFASSPPTSLHAASLP
jgi:hypothetical protein